MRRVLTVVALLTLALSSVAFAQVDRATITGTVTDSGGAVIAGATVTITNLATNVAIRQPTTETGSYLLVNLIPGKYQIDVELTGFKKSVADGHARSRPAGACGRHARSRRRQRDRHRRRDDAAAELERRARSARSIPQFQMSNLPLAIRNWDDLLALVPGVQGDRYTEQGGGTSFGRTGGINVHGARALQNNFLLDGVDNNSISENVQELTTQVSRPSVDAIQEFKVVTSPYSAEYGRSPGAAVSVSTKSGTNSDPRYGVRVLPQPGDGLDRLLLEARQRRQTRQQAEPVRRQRRRPAHQGPRVLLRRLRGDAHHPRRDAAHQRADGRPARGHLHHGRSRIRPPA